MDAKMELDRKRRRIAASEFKEQVRVNLNRYLQNNPNKTLREIAALTGYSFSAVKHFRNGSNPTTPVAMALIIAIPELSDQLRCPTCGALPTVSHEK